ncbi:MAG: asparaginase [Candidatus Gastranaerophilaceae bacterium]
MADYCPEKILEYVRSGLIEQEHFGFFVKIASDGTVFKVGDDKNYPFYLRSCAKPLQASLLIDFGLDKFYDMTGKEIAICCASHAGEPCHVETVKGFLDKAGINENLLKCGFHKPLSKTEQNKLLLSGEKENVLQNNCSGKHAMMLAVCKKMGWGINDYDNPEHPLQTAIRKKIYELCEIPPTPTLPLKGGGSKTPTSNFMAKKTNNMGASFCSSPSPLEGEGWGGGFSPLNYPTTRDGCGVPIYAMPLKNMVKGYLNLFLDKKYLKIRDAFVQNPYLIGGEDRLDTAIMKANRNLISKVGAGGLCIVVNLKKREGLVIKIMDCDMKARAIALIEALKQLGWLNETMLESDLIKAQNPKDILTLHGEKIGEANPTFKFA